MRALTRVCLVAGAIVGTLALPGLVLSASASGTHVKPTITTTEASFSIPTGSTKVWMIRLWTLPQPSKMVGQVVGSTGTISVDVPATSNCEFQVDVLVGPSGSTKAKQFTWYSGLIQTVPGCGSAHCPTAASIAGSRGPNSSGNTPPTITDLRAEFKIPAGTNQAWMLRLWTLPDPSTLEGQVIGSSGTLKLNVPLTQTCQFQVDVKVAPAGTTSPAAFTWYSGVTATV